MLLHTTRCFEIMLFLASFFFEIKLFSASLCFLCDLCAVPLAWVFPVFSPCLRITNPKLPRFLRKFFIEIKFFSASPRCNWFLVFSPCLRVSVVGFGLWLWLCYVVPPWWVLVLPA